ncbi:cobalamin-dependent protein [Streptomyces sp. NBC_01218]|uniref:cobalamin B12-binding domain-containing protein n=1 Tax=unclassified Streptomyces TaxID=2593676 RepID=UPI0023B963AB|nr:MULTISPECIES: cobalamin-dependent protein [unclassified Streptomyces]WEH38459.1 cobalamin-dependent protein [Streptomyces sp. AM 2-1-1]WSQ50117.1 cobalamin-dependent protein [Streptomyces sp. NBC_01218]
MSTSTLPAAHHPLSRLRTDLWDAVLEGDEYTATALVRDALDDGVDAESVLLDVIAPVQGRVGEEWAADRITVAQEHAATAINDRVVGVLSHGPGVPPTGAAGRVTVACVDGEWHALPARILAEVLTLRGWRVDYLGAQVPAAHLIAHLHRTGADAVALSASLATRLPAAHATITACQATGTPVLVGGAAFGTDGRYARLLGADAWAPDARAAARLLAANSGTRSRRVLQPIDDLPHLADQEYTLVVRSKARLVKAVLAGLDERFPGARAYTEAQRERTAEDIAHIVDFLAASLYTDDAGLFTRFLTWTTGILTARGVPAHSLVPALDILGEELRDFPRAALHLRLAAAPPGDAPCPPAPWDTHA